MIKKIGETLTEDELARAEQGEIIFWYEDNGFGQYMASKPIETFDWSGWTELGYTTDGGIAYTKEGEQ